MNRAADDDHRRIVNGILWVLNSGAPWRDLPRRYGPVGTVSSRFYRWRRSGVWHRVLEALQALADAEGRVGWDLHFLDSTVVRAHQHTAGARKADREPGDEALGRSRGGFTTKIHVRCEGYGKPVTFTLTGGQVHDSRQVSALINRGAIRRIGRGRPRLRPRRSGRRQGLQQPRASGEPLRQRGITPVIPTKANERAPARLRPRGISATQHHRAPDQPVEATSGGSPHDTKSAPPTISP